MSKPFFSILIPSYNRPEFIVKAVQSVLGNSFTDFELIISDDCSPRQQEIASNLEPFLADPRVTFYKQEANLREPANRAFLIEKANAEWLIFLSDDDLLANNAFELIRNQIEQKKDSLLFTFGYNYIDQFEHVKYERYSPVSFDIHLSNKSLVKEFICCDIFPYWFFSPVTFCFNKQVAESIKPNRSIGIGDDLMYLIDVVLKGIKVTVIPSVLMSYRRFDATGTDHQPNQTSGELPNVISRLLISRHLASRKEIDAEISSFINSYEFRKAFVYLPIVQSRLPLETIEKELALTSDELAELRPYFHTQTKSERLLIKIRRTIKFSKITGVKGLLKVFQLSFNSNFKI